MKGSKGEQKRSERNTNTQKASSEQNLFSQTELKAIASRLPSNKKGERVPSFMLLALKRHILLVGSQALKEASQGNINISVSNSFDTDHKCEICESDISNSDKQIPLCDCQHKNNFCESCLHHYAIYKISVYQEVLCPRDGCEALMNLDGDFFHQLPLDVQNKYRKIYQFYVTSKDPTKKLCPRENCEGLISQTSDTVLTCDKCAHSFCSKCLLTQHEGNCQQHEVDFFENNLHYRQCKKCKIIIEKNQGCNHMTCRCGMQFCYVCGQDWTAAHYGNHDANGRLSRNTVERNVPPPPVVQQQQWTVCRVLCAIILLFLFFIGYFLFALFILYLCCMILIKGFSSGLFMETCSLMSQLRGPLLFLAVILLPITLCIGICIGIGRSFAQDMAGLWTQYGRMARTSYRNIMQP